MKQREEPLDTKDVQEIKRVSQAALGASKQIWLAGLGAFTKAHEEGRKAFDELVKRGKQVEERNRALANQGTNLRIAAVPGASGKWNRLEQVFEQRVALALNRLGFYTASDMKKLAARVDQLSAVVNELVKRSSKQSEPGAKEVSQTPSEKS